MEVKAEAFDLDAHEPFRVYHTRIELYPPSGEKPAELEAAVLEVPGITGCMTHRYRLIVAKAPLFEWAEIDPLIIDLLKLFAGVKRVLESVALTDEDGFSNLVQE
jgi:hypothetical protein